MRLGPAGWHRSLDPHLVRQGSGLYRCGGPLVFQLEEGFFKITAGQKCNQSCGHRADKEAYKRQWSVTLNSEPRETHYNGHYEMAGHFKYKSVDKVQTVTDLSEKLQHRTLYNLRPAARPQQERSP